ncbi:hypothetical protein L1987_30129 [Smallanthus sonchifolius]|uniref:Uncharacterized protein n=1 Tax=Smallanthus sonchifolius TaxID=185202 RepID=A0ACB9I2K9_9ASTR|nr:hypothetical protein L1987_30129 [Smallanthus sonchifolius]
MLQIAASSANRGGESSSSKPKPFHSELKDAPYERFTKPKDDRIRHTVAIKQNYNHPPNVGETEIEGTELKDNIERVKQIYEKRERVATQWEKEKQMFLKEIKRLKKEQEDPLERKNLDELFPPLEGQHHAGALIEDEVHTALKGEEGIANHDPKDDALNDDFTRNDNFALWKKKWTTEKEKTGPHINYHALPSNISRL